MMFNGLLMCTDSDSDFAKESVYGSSAAESPSSSCDSARAHYYQNKLLATLQILQNKEETVLVQAESLAVAEARISSLTARGAELKKEIERKGRELQALRNSFEVSVKEKIDVSVTAHIQEMENQENVVTTLRDNLSVVEDLYRECFYETVKQENLIEMLRESYLDVRLLDKDKSDQITKLNSVINTQKSSLDRCQDMATEVDNLKMEILNFLNNSNNDSGMWEESIAGELNEDLQDIAAQLLRLRELLTGDCTCGLSEENKQLKKNNQMLERDIGDLRQKILELEANLENKDKLDKKSQEHIESKENELNCVRKQLVTLQNNFKELTCTCDNLKLQLNQAQVLLRDKSAELQMMHTQCEESENTIRSMREPIERSQQVVKENIALRNECRAVSRRALRLHRQAQGLEEEMARARAHCEHIEACYKAKASSAAELEAQLDAAQARGAALCAEARTVVRAVRGWALRVRDMHREQEHQIKVKESELSLLQERLEQKQSDMVASITRTEPLCRHCSALAVGERQRVTSAGRSLHIQSEVEATCSKDLTQRSESSLPTVCVRERRGNGVGTSASEKGSCSSTPVPRKRTMRKMSSPTSVIRIPQRQGWFGPWTCEAGVQLPLRRDAASDTTRDHTPPPRPQRAARDARARPARAVCIATPPTPRAASVATPPTPRAARGATPPTPRAARGATPPTPRAARGATLPTPHAACPASPPAPPRPSCVCEQARAARQRLPRSPGEEMFARLENMTEALADGYRRWTRARRDDR